MRCGEVEAQKEEEEIEEEMEQEIRGSKNQKKRDWIGAFISPPETFLLDFLNPE